MKKIFALAVMAVVLCGCGSNKYMVRDSVVDYSKYVKSGFFITESNSVSFDYVPVGSIMVESITGYVDEVSKTGYNGQPQNYKIKDCNLEDAFERICKVGKERNANGVINVQMTFSPPYSIEHIRYPARWVVTGMLIKK